jgi:dynamin 1-like protein
LCTIKLVVDDENEWFELFDRRGEKIYGSDDIRRVIEQETEKVAGKNKGVSSVPLKVRYHSRNVLDLMLIDLPGLTKNPVGDQPLDIEQKVLDLVLPFLKNPNSLILAVSKAQDDLATSEGLKLARQVDPQGVRTIGVITQLDLMDEGNDALNDLLNKTYPLQLGYVGVVMRGAKDIQKNKTVHD